MKRFHLRLGQWIRAFLVNRIFRGEHEKRRRQLARFAAESDLAFLHGLEQRGLHLRRRAVDFVGENKVGEDRSLRDVIFPILRAVDQIAHDVGGQQVRRELDAAEARLHRRREGADGKRLGQTGHAFEQHVAVGEQADQQALDQLFLANNHAAHFRA